MIDAENCIKLENRQMQMNLLEGTHYRRRFYQPSHVPHKSKELVNCLFCDTSSYLDDDEHAGGRVGRQKRCKGILRLDKLLKHIKDKHPECLPTEGRSLLSMGFTRAGGDVCRNISELPADDVGDPIGLDRLSGDNADHDTVDFSARVAARHTP
jgi:hypothetical protein